MLGVDLGELGVVFVVALVVLGPTRLPGLVRKIGRWVGKARSMARDFQQQLENEVNLDELNRMTDDIKRQAQGSTTAAPSEFSGDLSTIQPAAEPDINNLAAGGYPYGVQEPVPETMPEVDPASAPQPGDDSFSHAHGQGEAPMADEAPVTADVDINHKKDSDAA